jgi:hypothetical protein
VTLFYKKLHHFIFSKSDAKIVFRTAAQFILIFACAACTQKQISGPADYIIRDQRVDINISLFPCKIVIHTQNNKHEITLSVLHSYENQIVSEIKLYKCLYYLGTSGGLL